MLEKYANCEPVNIGYGKTVTIKEIVQMILKAADYQDAEVVFDASKPTAIPFRMVDTSKAKEVLGFKPEISLEEGLKKTIDWYRRDVICNIEGGGLTESRLRRLNKASPGYEGSG